MEVEQPLYLDIVAQDFPELKLIAGHGGWPWMQEMVAVAWRNANLYIDISGYLPKYIGMQGTGWEPLIHFGNSVIQDRVLFGSVWILMGMSIKQLAEGVKKLPLREEVKAKWLYHNVARLFGVA